MLAPQATSSASEYRSIDVLEFSIYVSPKLSLSPKIPPPQSKIETWAREENYESHVGLVRVELISFLRPKSTTQSRARVRQQTKRLRAFWSRSQREGSCIVGQADGSSCAKKGT